MSAATEFFPRFGEGALSPASLRAYESDWNDFKKWCWQERRQPLPCTPATVVAYFQSLAESHAYATIGRRRAAIQFVHRNAGFTNPTTADLVREAVRNIRLKIRVAPVQKTALTHHHLQAMSAAMSKSLKSQRDWAIMLLGRGSALRRSEIAALDLSDLRFEHGLVVILVRRSMTDQHGRGEYVVLEQDRNTKLCPVRALRAWIDAAGIRSGPIFRTFTMRGELQANRIDGRDVARAVQKFAKQAGLFGDFGGQSLRSGYAEAALDSRSIRAIARLVRNGRNKTLGAAVKAARITPTHPLDVTASTLFLKRKGAK